MLLEVQNIIHLCNLQLAALKSRKMKSFFFTEIELKNTEFNF